MESTSSKVTGVDVSRLINKLLEVSNQLENVLNLVHHNNFA